MINALITGCVGRDAEIGQAPNGDVRASFTVASNRKVRGEERTTWVRCTLWGQRVNVLAQHIVRGKRVAITGSLELSESSSGRTYLDCRVSEIEFLGGAESGNGARRPRQEARPPAQPADYDDVEGDDEPAC